LGDLDHVSPSCDSCFYIVRGAYGAVPDCREIASFAYIIRRIPQERCAENAQEWSPQ